MSLRNINTIFVFNRDSGKIKFIWTGTFIWQHDPDFINGNRISVFDNRPVAGGADAEKHSRIVIISAPDDRQEVYYQGSMESPFYTHILGKHQWLPNGNLLIVESMKGRAFEIDFAGEVVWQYQNYLADGIVGLVEEVQRLPASYRWLYVADDQ